MNPRLLVFVDRATADARTRVDLRTVTARGFGELQALIEQEAAVLDVEMFTNDWYDGMAERVLALLSSWEARRVAFTLREVPPGVTADAVDGDRTHVMTLRTLRNVIRVGQRERARMEAFDGLRATKSR